MSITSTLHDVFHEGERAVQQRVGAVAQGRNSGRLVADTILPGAIKFVKKQPFVVTGSVDKHHNLWASVVVGSGGFILAEPRALHVDLSQTLLIERDPLWQNLGGDPRIGVLVIDLQSRARLRVNGRGRFPEPSRMRIDVDQAYPNCPKYIQRRSYRPATGPNAGSRAEVGVGTTLSERQQAWIANADTMFVASEHPAGGVDASHRGGNPGFIQVISPYRLRVPDYTGNGMFNTLGNFAVNARAGLVIPDFDNGRTLQLSGRAEVLWDVDDPQNETGGTGRYWEFGIERWVEIENSLPGSSEFLDYSPHNPSFEVRPRR